MNLAPLENPALKGPGILEKIGGIFGHTRPLACAQIEITSVCQAACAYCPHTAQAKGWRSRHMTPETFASIWPVLRRTARAHLQGWGEPLLHPHFFEFQRLAKRAGCLTSTTSAGVRLNDEILEKVAHSGMDIVAFSLAGTDAASNAIRRNADFSEVCDNIRKLRKLVDQRKLPLEIHIAYLMLADRIDAVKRLPELMEELGVDMAVVSALDYLALPQHKELAFLPHESEKVKYASKLLNEARARAESSNRFLVFSLPGPVPFPNGCRENVGHNIYIDADGDLSPCIYLNVPGSDPAEKRKIFGNAGNGDCWELWQGEEFSNFRKRCLSSNPDPVCQNCPKRWDTLE